MADMDQFKWYALNDNVMGGVSAGNVTKDDDGNLRFFGKLSKKNRGGFASCRTELPENLLAGTDGLSFKVRRQFYSIFTFSGRFPRIHNKI